MQDVITIGTATRDIFIKSSSLEALNGKGNNGSAITGQLECLPLGSKIEARDIFFGIGGAATNAAVTFARQGFKTGILTRVGSDASGEEVERVLRRENIDTSRIIVDRKNSTAYSIILSHNSGERSIIIYRGASAQWQKADFHTAPLEAKWFYITSFGGNFEALEEVIRIAKKHKIRIAMNPGTEEIKQPHKLVPFLYSIDVLIMNREEGARFTGVPFENEKEIFKRIDELEPGIFVLTDGKKGSWISDGRRAYFAGVFREKSIIDRNGAGDAFGSGFVSGIMRRSGKIFSDSLKNLRADDISYAIRLGSANATSKVEGVGAKHGLLSKNDFEKNIRWQGLSLKVEDLI